MSYYDFKDFKKFGTIHMVNRVLSLVSGNQIGDKQLHNSQIISNCSVFDGLTVPKASANG
ncbi:MAG: hypothetical protein PVS3B1_29690 [Ktedonobacteraceae bacterium]